MTDQDSDTIHVTVQGPSEEEFEAEVPPGTNPSEINADFFVSQSWPTRGQRGRGQRAVVELVDPENPDHTDTIRLTIESPTGEMFEADVSQSTLLGKLASDFFGSRGWPTQDSRGRSQRAVVELVNPENPNDTKRLHTEQSVGDADLRDGAILRIFPESVAGCFPGDVRVSLANGETKLIRDVKIGDLLLSGVPGSSEATVAQVARVFRDIAQGYLVLNNTLPVTENHPIWANERWHKAGELQIGDLMQNQSGQHMELKFIERRNERIPVFNLYLSSAEHTFFAEEILVHNQMLKEAAMLLNGFEVDEQIDRGETRRISRQEYELLQGLVQGMEQELVAQRKEMSSLEERIETIENKLTEISRTFGDISSTLRSESRIVFMESESVLPAQAVALSENEESQEPIALARLKIDRQMETFGEAEQRELVKSIAHQTGASEEELELLYVIAGCVTVVLKMSPEAAAELVRLFYGNPSPELAALGISEIEIRQLPSGNSVPQLSAPSPTLEDTLRRKIRTLQELERRAARYAPGEMPIEMFNQIEDLKEQICQSGEQIFV